MNRKPRLPLEEISQLLAAQSLPVTGLAPIREGLESQAFACALDGFPAVLRINRTITGFEKDRFAYENFHSERLPIPRVLQLGWLDATHAFCLSQRLPGDIVHDVDASTAERLAAPTFACWQAMGEADISVTTGFGDFDGAGNGESESWQAYLLSQRDLDWAGLHDVDMGLVGELNVALAELAPL